VQLWAALLLQWTFGSFLGRYLGLPALASITLGGGLGSVLISANFASKTISTASTGPGMALLGGRRAWLGWRRLARLAAAGGSCPLTCSSATCQRSVSWLLAGLCFS
jgi:hypothetical protein